MRKVVAGLFMSLDGVVEAAENWAYQYFNDELSNLITAGIAQADIVLLGRVPTWSSLSCGRVRAATCRWRTS